MWWHSNKKKICDNFFIFHSKDFIEKKNLCNFREIEKSIQNHQMFGHKFYSISVLALNTVIISFYQFGRRYFFCVVCRKASERNQFGINQNLTWFFVFVVVFFFRFQEINSSRFLKRLGRCVWQQRRYNILCATIRLSSLKDA